MRYLLVGLLLTAVLVVGIAGFRGGTSRKPPIEVFPDMDRQLKLHPQHTSEFFADGRSSRPPVPGTVARSSPYLLSRNDPERLVYPFEAVPATTGVTPGTTNFVETIPFEITAQFIGRGQEQYRVYCAPCHSPVGDGNGITKQFGMAVVANLHDPRIVRMTDGELFHVITSGRNLMGPYGPLISVPDRWAIIAYLRALQMSRLATVEDVPEQMRSGLR